MMTMLHSVLSGGGSAAGRNRSLLALGALLALIASVLVWASPTQAQGSNQPPVAIALNPTLNEDGAIALDGSYSFDPDDNVADEPCGAASPDTSAQPAEAALCTYKWEIVTSTYLWLGGFLAADTDAASNATVELEGIDLASLVASNGAIIEFKLTVTDAGGASDSANVTYNIETTDKPVADIVVTATTAGDGVDANSDGTISALEKFSDDAVIDGPGENGNGDSEWDIKEDSLLVLDASGSSDPDTPQGLTYTWELLFETGQTGDDRFPRATNGDTQESTLAVLNNVGTDNTKVSTNDPTTNGADDDPPVIETVGRLNVGVRNQSPYYAIYQLTVTDTDNNSGVARVEIVIHDQPAAPTVSVSIMNDSADTPDVDTDASQGPAGLVPRPGLQGTLPPGSGRYVVHAGEDFTLLATAYDADFDTDGNDELSDTEDDAQGVPAVDWDGGDLDDEGDAAGFQVEIPDDADDGDTFTITASVRGTDVSASVTFTVADGNTRPVATVLSQAVDPQPTGEDAPSLRQSVVSATVKDGVYTVNGFGFDPDGGSVVAVWTQLIDNKAAEADHDDYVALTGAFSNSVSFDRPTNPKHSGKVNLSFAVIDDKGAFDIKSIRVDIAADPDAPAAASAGDDRVVGPQSAVVLAATASGFDATDTPAYVWTIKSVSTSPGPERLSARASGQVHEDLNELLEAVTGRNLTNTGETVSDATGDALDIGDVLSAISAPTGANPGEGPFQYFTAPKLSAGLKYAQITFSVAVTAQVDGANVTKDDEVTITVATDFFDSYVDSPDFCAGRSLGGPATYPHDSDGDGVADVCSLDSTRRVAVARQNALQQLADLGLTINVTDSDDRASGATLADLVLGRDGSDPVGTVDQPNYAPAVSAVVGTCSRAKALGLKSDDPDACDDDATALTPLPEAIDPAEADLYYSGIISGPDFCTNHSLGGPRTYAHDDDDDGVADVCSLHTTRREAVALQMALVMFEDHPQFENAFNAACDAIGSETYGASAADLAGDACSVGLNPQTPGRGSVLPAP